MIRSPGPAPAGASPSAALRRGLALAALLLGAPAFASSGATAAPAVPAAPAARALGLDTADAARLGALPEVGPALAGEIVALRKARGGLGSVEELRILPGITEGALDSLRAHTAVHVELPMGPPRRFDSPQQVLAQFAFEPTVQQVQAWANDYAKTSPQAVERWLRQSKTFAALPTVWLRFRFTEDWDQDFQYYATDGLIDTDGEAVFAALDDAGRGQQAQYYVQARWDLDQLVMSSERIRIINEAQDIARLRDKVLTEVNRVYFERRRVQAEMLLAPKGDVLGQVKDELRLMELTANLDAMTGGRFSGALARAGRTP